MSNNFFTISLILAVAFVSVSVKYIDALYKIQEATEVKLSEEPKEKWVLLVSSHCFVTGNDSLLYKQFSTSKECHLIGHNMKELNSNVYFKCLKIN